MNQSQPTSISFPPMLNKYKLTNVSLIRWGIDINETSRKKYNNVGFLKNWPISLRSTFFVPVLASWSPMDNIKEIPAMVNIGIESRLRHQAQATEPDVVVSGRHPHSDRGRYLPANFVFSTASRHGAVNLRSASNNLHRGCDQVSSHF